MKKIKLLALLSVLISGTMYGDIKLDSSKLQNTTIEKTNRGNTIININKANGKGISVNEFIEFRTKDGVIFNNSTSKFSNSKLEGMIERNDNLNGQAAKLILNKVGGQDRTEIENYMELVSRNKADMIFSSPNGVFLNGAEFIGFKDVTFTTANVQLDQHGNIAPFTVNNNKVIQIGEKGLQAGDIEKLSLLSTSISVDGSINAKDVDLITGHYNYDYDTKSYTGSANGGKITLENLGSIYGDQINLITINGAVGVNGDIIANEVNVTGTITNRGFIYSRDRVTFDTMVNDTYGNIISSNISGAALTNNGDIEADNVLIRGELANKGYGRLSSEGELLLKADVLTNIGSIYANNIKINANQFKGNSGYYGDIKANGNIDILADSVNTGRLYGTNININASESLIVNGEIRALNNVKLKSKTVNVSYIVKGKTIDIKYTEKLMGNLNNIGARDKYIEKVNSLD